MKIVITERSYWIFQDVLEMITCVQSDRYAAALSTTRRTFLALKPTRNGWETETSEGTINVIINTLDLLLDELPGGVFSKKVVSLRQQILSPHTPDNLVHLR